VDLLLDTHAFLWFTEGNDKLSAVARRAIEANEGQRLLSVASGWEIAIKVSLGKLTLAKPVGELLPELMSSLAVAPLAIEMVDVAAVALLPFHHRDSFARMLAAQARERGLSIVSVDAVFESYGVTRIWQYTQQAVACDGSSLRTLGH
jgi:PIN domain nuclease of toxin-antitoxin system